MKRTIAAIAALATALCAAIAPATAKAPGSNGRIAFNVYDPAADNLSITTANADGSDPTPVVTPGFAVNPVWSPDGSKLLFGTFTDAGFRPATINLDGSGYTVLASPELPSYLDRGPCLWIPHSARILCHVRNFTTSDHSWDGIYSMDAVDGAHPTRLTVNPYPPGGAFGGGDVPGDVSPDGTRFVFMRARPDPGHVPGREQSGALFVANIDGTGMRQITDYGLPNSHDNGVESWSPDGSTILFASAHGTLFRVHPDGTGLSAISVHGVGTFTDIRAPGWSPDGTRIVVRMYAQATHQADIYTLAPDGTNLVRVTSTGLVDSPDWGPQP